MEGKLVRLVRALGLNYGAADFVLTPEGRYVFLEVNPVGEFAWLDMGVPLPIGQTIAAMLVENARSTKPRRLLAGA